MIRVIETTTAERKDETIALFEKIKPYQYQKVVLLNIKQDETLTMKWKFI